MSRRRGAIIAAILIVLIVVMVLYRGAWWPQSREDYMAGYQIFPPSSAQGYSYNESPYPMTGCRETMYRSPFDDPQERAKYGDRRPLCFEAGAEKEIPFDVRNQYYGGEFGWRQSLYI